MINTMFKTFTMLGSEWVLWILMILSILSLAIIFERWRNLRNQEKLGSKLWKELIDKWMVEGVTPELSAKAKEISNTYPCLEGNLIEVLSNQKLAGIDEKSRLAQSFLGRKKLELERYLAFLGTVGSNAPFIGLFGTVLGIIKAFHDLGGHVETTGAQTISSGISEALVATAVGLMVAIPAVVFFNYFQRKIKMIIGRAESLSNYILSQQK